MFKHIAEFTKRNPQYQEWHSCSAMKLPVTHMSHITPKHVCFMSPLSYRAGCRHLLAESVLSHRTGSLHRGSDWLPAAIRKEHPHCHSEHIWCDFYYWSQQYI